MGARGRGGFADTARAAVSVHRVGRRVTEPDAVDAGGSAGADPTVGRGRRPRDPCGQRAPLRAGE